MQYVEFEVQGKNLHITLLPAGKEYIEVHLIDIGTDTLFTDLIEHQICNGWRDIQPEEIGAMTSCIILSDDVETDDENKITKIGKVYTNIDDYQIVSPCQKLWENDFVDFRLAAFSGK